MVLIALMAFIAMIAVIASLLRGRRQRLQTGLGRAQRRHVLGRGGAGMGRLRGYVPGLRGALPVVSRLPMPRQHRRCGTERGQGVGQRQVGGTGQGVG